MNVIRAPFSAPICRRLFLAATFWFLSGWRSSIAEWIGERWRYWQTMHLGNSDAGSAVVFWIPGPRTHHPIRMLARLTVPLPLFLLILVIGLLLASLA